MTQDHFGALLRSLRDQAAFTPGAPSRRRRASGMRRQELAEAAGVSIDYIIQLEQGRSTSPSVPVVAALAQALGVGGDQTSALFQAAGHATPTASIRRTLDPATRRLLDRIGGVAAAVYSADWWMLGWNRLWAKLLGDPDRFSDNECNLVWQVFTSDAWRPIPHDRSVSELKQELANDLRRESISFPRDRQLRDLINELRTNTAEFAEMWQHAVAARHGAERKTVRHPSGQLLLDVDVFRLAEHNQHLVVYSAEPGTNNASSLARLE